MSDYRSLLSIRSISLGDKPLFPDVISETRTTERADGTQVTAHVEAGKLVGYSARDKNGKPVEVRVLRMTSGSPDDDGASLQKNCWLCFCDDTHCQCDPAACPRHPQ
jgi:hypothetical protein